MCFAISFARDARKERLKDRWQRERKSGQLAVGQASAEGAWPTELTRSLERSMVDLRARRATSVGEIVGVRTGSLCGWPSASQAKKSVFHSMEWDKLAFSSRCHGLVRERLDRRRTANVAAKWMRAAKCERHGYLCLAD